MESVGPAKSHEKSLFIVWKAYVCTYISNNIGMAIDM